MEIITNTYLEIKGQDVNIRTDFFNKDNGEFLDMESSSNLSSALNNEQKKILIKMIDEKLKAI